MPCGRYGRLRFQADSHQRIVFRDRKLIGGQGLSSDHRAGQRFRFDCQQLMSLFVLRSLLLRTGKMVRGTRAGCRCAKLKRPPSSKISANCLRRPDIQRRSPPKCRTGSCATLLLQAEFLKRLEEGDQIVFALLRQMQREARVVKKEVFERAAVPWWKQGACPARARRMGPCILPITIARPRSDACPASLRLSLGHAKSNPRTQFLRFPPKL
jgi:hypothetical protein